MGRGRPRKGLAYHLIAGTYRRDRHGPLPGSGEIAVSMVPDPPEPAEPHPLDDEVMAWWWVFTAGRDFFCELGRAGVFPAATYDPVAMAEQVRRASKKAWRRLGARYLERWEPHGPPPHRQVPWALIQFGEP